MRGDIELSNQQKPNEQILQTAVQKLAKKYEAIIKSSEANLTMIMELQDNLNQVIAISYALLKEKQDKIVELQAPVNEKALSNPQKK